jgi:hypothetical protein
MVRPRFHLAADKDSIQLADLQPGSTSAPLPQAIARANQSVIARHHHSQIQFRSRGRYESLLAGLPAGRRKLDTGISFFNTPGKLQRNTLRYQDIHDIAASATPPEWMSKELDGNRSAPAPLWRSQRILL